MRCAGMPEGEYELGGQPVWMKEGKATLADGTHGRFFHSSDGWASKAVSFGVPLEQAVMAATSAPAKAIGMEREIGCIPDRCTGRSSDSG